MRSHVCAHVRAWGAGQSHYLLRKDTELDSIERFVEGDQECVPARVVLQRL